MVEQSNYNKKYLHLDGTIGSQKGNLEFIEKDPKYVFEADDASGHVKIKCSENHLYLTGVRSTTGDNSTIWLIVAAAPTITNESDEEHSTLFKLKDFEPTKNTFRVRHVKSNLYLAPRKVRGGSNAVLCAVGTKPDPGNADLFTALRRT
ncbi:hypothetical protein D8674_028200 [Pyrus ussuriensis x Pyrus communis]|uniref:Agglutinin domain-containing protein n=1 Tax=Pyrus ussuriensis x Pyrus communis TaxID=2448454 RepID=A0A5N5HYM9_9ROSA|nr:hypothetical protein D8674_028200 [Pyrus ussuriensis x Pyrus communis]